MSAKIRDESCTPTEEDCIAAINESLDNYYLIAARGDIAITFQMKRAAYNMFVTGKWSMGGTLSRISADWFLRTQLQGFGPIPPRFTEPFGRRI